MIPRSALRFTDWLRLVLLAAMLAAPATMLAQAPPSQGLADRAAANGRVRVLVQVNVPFAPEGRLSAPARADQRAAIARAQDIVSATLDGADVRTFAAIPWLGAEVSAAQLQALRNNPNVLAI